MGRYVPPDQEGTISANKLQRKRPPGALNAAGIQTVRFEMPFAIWCTTCPAPHTLIGQGVRFNAEKRKLGYYFSTPIWMFRMKHTACGGWIEIKTDPKATAYVVVSGARARDYGPDEIVKEGEGGAAILTEAERERRREDAFAGLEGRVEEKVKTDGTAKRIQGLLESRERDWDDPFAANKRIRRTFRTERKVLEKEDRADEALKARLGTEIDLLPAMDEDARRARLIDFGEDLNGTTERVEAKALFASRSTSSKSRNKAMIKEDKKDVLRRRLVGNTRAALNPFGG